MNKKFFCIAMMLLVMPALLIAQGVVSEDGKTMTITEETVTENGKIVTTTVLEKNVVFTNGLWNNWDLTVGAGAHLYYGDNDWKVGNKLEMITAPVFDLYLTKWISPSFGIGISASSGRFKGLYQARENISHPLEANFRTDIPYSGADPKYDYMQLSRQRGWFTNVYADFHVDLCNLIGGYNPDRFYIADAYLGGGLIMGHDQTGFIPSATANVGLINKFRLTKDIMLALNFRGALVADDFDGELYVQEPDMEHRNKNFKMDGNAGVTVGLTINLGKGGSKWRPASRVSTIITNDIHDVVPVPQIEKVVDTVRVSNVPDVWFHINFNLDKWDLLSREMVNLHAISDLIKSTPDVRYLICGYADKQTANPEHNMMLSENRSKAVYDALVNEFGVNPNQLVREYKGGVDYMFYNEKELSRCVMITAIHEE